ncbi:hypothetical protein F4809DRAFT_631588 [Biscogniauxia mediterranea]|nr:hypothetical protein F4809DRAFT_631588 [Biscogniauxia mediterranea]
MTITNYCLYSSAFPPLSLSILLFWVGRSCRKFASAAWGLGCWKESLVLISIPPSSPLAHGLIGVGVLPLPYSLCVARSREST